MGEGDGKDRIRDVACAVTILHEERGIIIRGINVGRYGKLTCAALDRSFNFNGSLISFTCKVDTI